MDKGYYHLYLYLAFLMYLMSQSTIKMDKGYYYMIKYW